MEKMKSQGIRMTSSWTHLRTSIALLKKYPEQIILISLLPTLTFQLGTMVGSINLDLGLLISFTGALWLLVSIPALLCLELSGAQQSSMTTAALYRKGLKFFWRIWGVTLITSLLISLGFILLIVPGCMLLRRYALAPYYVIDKKLGVFAAMKQSAIDSSLAPGFIWGSIGVLLSVSFASIVTGLVFSFIPGVADIVTSILTLTAMFVLALRYNEITQRTTKEKSHTS